MKPVFYLLISFIFLFSCESPKKMMLRGRYHEAVYASVKKLQKNRTKEKHILVLEEAYPKAVTQDEERIKFLKMDSKPEAWDEINTIYVKLKNRQDLLRTVIPLELDGRQINFTITDYDKEILNSKMRAADYYYTHAKELMESDDRKSNREAYQCLVKVKTYYNTYEDVDVLMQDAKFKGTAHTKVEFRNNSIYKLNDEFANNVLSVASGDVNTEWIKYYQTAPSSGFNFDFFVIVNIKAIEISSEKVNEKNYSETKNIEDGYAYQYDEKGNVKKDTAGNDIKVKKYKKVTCNVRETLQEKGSRIVGAVEYYDGQSKQMVYSANVQGSFSFSNMYATAQGEIIALSEETKRKLQYRPVAFPNDIQMIEEAKSDFNNSLRSSLKNNSRYLD